MKKNTKNLRAEHKQPTSHKLEHLLLPTVESFPGGAVGKESACQCRRHEFDPLVRKTPWRRKWQSTPSILAWEVPRTEEPSGFQSMESQRIRHDWACTYIDSRKYRAVKLALPLESEVLGYLPASAFIEIVLNLSGLRHLLCQMEARKLHGHDCSEGK